MNRLEKACFDRDAWPWMDILAVLTFPGVVRLKAVASGNVIGFVAGDRVKKNTVGRIITIGVLPEYQRQGVGRNLLFSAERALDTAIFQLVLRKTNLKALQLYHKAAYRIVDTWPGYYSNGEDGIVMEKTGGSFPVL